MPTGYNQSEQTIGNQIGTNTIHHNLADLLPSTSEIGHLWTVYQAESMSICFLKKWTNETTDPDIRLIIQEALDISTQRVKAMDNLLDSINYPKPYGFGEKDVNLDAPALFSQSFFCLYMRMTHKMVMHHYVSAITSAYRPDFREFYSQCLLTSDDIHRKATALLMVKGLLQRHPSIVPPNSFPAVADKKYFGSYFFKHKRPLNAVEISHIYSLIEIKRLIRTLNIGLCQVVKSDKIKSYLLRAKEIADKQLATLSELLTNEEIPSPVISEFLITDAREPGFSDKLILTHATAITAYVTSAYGLAMPNMFRKDLDIIMAKYIAELLGLARDGAQLLTDYGWFERVPETPDRYKLIH
ncbi:MAG: DUF3231 family protein [Peptococcaceae bacterium]|jgi:hypothetical protein|nr:DUF3231 family protein [Peptococcaceae bacterium]